MKKQKEVKEELVEEEVQEEVTEKERIEEKVTNQIRKKRDKEDNKPSRILEYMKTEHKWENYVFVFISVLVLMLGILILTGVLVVREDFPVIGQNAKVYGWVLVVVASLGTLYALFPFINHASQNLKRLHG